MPYLKALEQSLSASVDFLFVLAKTQENVPILAGVFQLASFTYKKGAQANLLLKLFQDCKNSDESVSIKGLICGNIFATGAHGYAHTDLISKQSACELMAATAQTIKNDAAYDALFSVLLFKDFASENARQAEILKDFKYRDFQADVVMQLKLQPSWASFSDYLHSMKAKYRTKANSAYKKSQALTIQSLTVSQIVENESRLRALFENILSKSDYQYGEHYPNSFKALKESLGEAFICKGAFLDGELIGFSTAFENGTSLEASYVGIDYEHNTKYAVYERLLYDYVEEAIQRNVAQLHLGRTSELIKSALGAVPTEMTLFVKHRSKLKNALLKPIVDTISPSEYQLRRPFKTEYYTN